jgi:hypothetical protein
MNKPLFWEPCVTTEPMRVLLHSIAVNLLKPTFYFMYHQIKHSRIVHGDYTAFMLNIMFCGPCIVIYLCSKDVR